MLSFRFIVGALTIFASMWFLTYPVYSKSIEITNPEEVPALIKALKFEKEDIRVEAAYKLGSLWPQQDVEGAFAALIEAMKDPSEQVRISAASALGELKAEQAVNVLINATHDQSSEVVLFAAQSLGEIGSSAAPAVPELLNLLENESCNTRQVAAIALAHIDVNVERAVPVMIKDLALSNKWARHGAALALGLMGKAAQPAIPALKRLLKDQSWDVQQQACRTLRNIGTSEAKDALKEYPESCDSRPSAKVSVEQEVSMLIEDLSLSKEFLRLSAVLSLGRMGQAAQPAIPALKNLLTDQSHMLQQEACNSLRQIGTSEALDAIKAYSGDCFSGFIE
jgi:vesicle coat complex subunit